MPTTVVSARISAHDGTQVKRGDEPRRPLTSKAVSCVSEMNKNDHRYRVTLSGDGGTPANQIQADCDLFVKRNHILGLHWLIFHTVA